LAERGARHEKLSSDQLALMSPIERQIELGPAARFVRAGRNSGSGGRQEETRRPFGRRAVAANKDGCGGPQPPLPKHYLLAGLGNIPSPRFASSTPTLGFESRSIRHLINKIIYLQNKKCRPRLLPTFRDAMSDAGHRARQKDLPRTGLVTRLIFERAGSALVVGPAGAKKSAGPRQSGLSPTLPPHPPVTGMGRHRIPDRRYAQRFSDFFKRALLSLNRRHARRHVISSRRGDPARAPLTYRV
jgi:hypothetical protein